MEQWRRLVSELIHVCYRMSDVVSPVVQSSSPEGLIPMDSDSGKPSRNQVRFSHSQLILTSTCVSGQKRRPVCRGSCWRFSPETRMTSSPVPESWTHTAETVTRRTRPHTPQTQVSGRPQPEEPVAMPTTCALRGVFLTKVGSTCHNSDMQYQLCPDGGNVPPSFLQTIRRTFEPVLRS